MSPSRLGSYIMGWSFLCMLVFTLAWCGEEMIKRDIRQHEGGYMTLLGRSVYVPPGAGRNKVTPVLGLTVLAFLIGLGLKLSEPAPSAGRFRIPLPSPPSKDKIKSTFKGGAISIFLLWFLWSCGMDWYEHDIRAWKYNYCRNVSNASLGKSSCVPARVDLRTMSQKEIANYCFYNSGQCIPTDGYNTGNGKPRPAGFFPGTILVKPSPSDAFEDLSIFLGGTFTYLMAIGLLIAVSIITYQLMLFAAYYLKKSFIPLDLVLAWSGAIGSIILILVLGKHLPVWTLLFPLIPFAYGVLIYAGAFSRKPGAVPLAASDLSPQGFYPQETIQGEQKSQPYNDLEMADQEFPIPPPDSEEAVMTNLDRGQSQNSYLKDLRKELEEILKHDDRGLLAKRIDALRHSMDSNVFEQKIASWLRKYKAGLEVLETVNKAERAKMEHDFMPLERQKKEAELKADIEHHKARESEAKMRQRMAGEE